MRRTLRFLQKRLKYTDCSLRPLQNELQPSTQKSPLRPVRNRFCSRLIQNAARIDGVGLIDVQFG